VQRLGRGPSAWAPPGSGVLRQRACLVQDAATDGGSLRPPRCGRPPDQLQMLCGGRGLGCLGTKLSSEVVARHHGVTSFVRFDAEHAQAPRGATLTRTRPPADRPGPLDDLPRTAPQRSHPRLAAGLARRGGPVEGAAGCQAPQVGQTHHEPEAARLRRAAPVRHRHRCRGTSGPGAERAVGRTSAWSLWAIT
jgi:hypothetical protein